MLNEDPEMEVIYDAPDGEALTSYIAGLKVKPDVCVLDINMPKMDGYETLKHLKLKHPDIRCLILTQHDHELVIIRMLRAGANAYVLKDAEPDELKRAIQTIMTEPYYQSRLISGHLHAMVQGQKDHEQQELTEKEVEFLKHCCSELSYKEIASLMGMGERKIDYLREGLFEKLHIQSRTGLALYALRLGLVSLDAER